MTALLLSRASLIVGLPRDAQAQLTNDPLRPRALGNADGVKDRFLTPFLQATTVKVYVNAVLTETGWTLSSGTGTEGADEIVFDPILSSGAISATADNRSIDAEVLDAVRRAVSSDVARYLPTGTGITDPWLLAVLEPIAIDFAKLRLRGRKENDVPDALDILVKAHIRWLEKIMGPTPLLPVSPSGSSDSPGEIRVYSEPEVFGPLGGE